MLAVTVPSTPRKPVRRLVSATFTLVWAFRSNCAELFAEATPVRIVLNAAKRLTSVPMRSAVRSLLAGKLRGLPMTMSLALPALVIAVVRSRSSRSVNRAVSPRASPWW